MGEYADMEIDRMAYWDDRVYDIIPVYPNPIFDIWTDQGGTDHEITGMTDLHLNNCIKMLKRGNSPLKDGYIKSMTKELERRSKMNLGQYNIPGLNNPQYGAPQAQQVPQEVEQPRIVNVDLKVAGVTFPNEDGTSRKAIIQEMAPMFEGGYKHKIDLVREPENKYDVNAIKVLADGMQIGYIGKEYASIMSPMIDSGSAQFSAVVKGCGEYKNRPYCEITINQL